MPEQKKIFYNDTEYTSASLPFRQAETWNAYRRAASRHAITKAEFGDGDIYLLSYKECTLFPTKQTYIFAKIISAIAEHSILSRGFVTMADIGTGTGLIAITIASHLAKKGLSDYAQCIASDISTDALTVAEINIAMNGLDNTIHLKHMDTLDGFSAEFGYADIIVSNPPYYDAEKSHEVIPIIPRLAVDGGENGFEMYEKILDQSREHMIRGATLALRVETPNAVAVGNMIGYRYPRHDLVFCRNPHAKVYGVIATPDASQLPFAEVITLSELGLTVST